MRPETQLSFHQCALFITYPKLTHYQAVKRVLKNLKGKPEQGLIMKPDPEKGIEFYVDDEFLAEEIKRKVSIPARFFLERATYLVTPTAQ